MTNSTDGPKPLSDILENIDAVIGPPVETETPEQTLARLERERELAEQDIQGIDEEQQLHGDPDRQLDAQRHLREDEIARIDEDRRALDPSLEPPVDPRE